MVLRPTEGPPRGGHRSPASTDRRMTAPIAVTPNLQWVINPALNEDVGSMTYFTIRARLAI